MNTRLPFLPSMADRISAISFLIKQPKSINPLGISLVAWERSHTLCEPMATRWKHCVPRPETRKIQRKLKNPEQHWHAPPLCTKQPVRGALSANRLRLKCCKRQCWPSYMSELTHDAVRIRLLSYILVIALRCTYKPYFPTIKLIMHKNKAFLQEAKHTCPN